MSYVFDWQCKTNGALAFLKGAPLSTLIAFTLYADDYGNAWCSTNSQKSGGLNKVTGLSHDAIAGTDGARRVLIEHGCIESVPRQTIRELYGERPVKKRPPVNAEVYHITKMIKQCADPACTCKKTLQAEAGDMYVFLTSKDFGHEVDSSSKTLEGSTSSADRPNIFVVYEQHIGMLTPMVSDRLSDIEKTYPAGWFDDAVGEAVMNNKRNLAYVEAILKRWKVEGRGPKNGSRPARDDKAIRHPDGDPVGYSHK